MSNPIEESAKLYAAEISAKSKLAMEEYALRHATELGLRDEYISDEILRNCLSYVYARAELKVLQEAIAKNIST